MISEYREQYSISNLVDLLSHRAATQPDKIAYIFLADGETEEIKLTYGELDRQARAIGAKLQNEVAPGDRALLLYPPGLEFISAFFGCLYAGVIAVPCYPPDPNKLDVSVAKLRGIIADCTPEIILTTKEFFNLAAFIFPDYPDLEKMNWLATDAVDAGLSDDRKEPEIDSESLAFLQYTSGSTGDPKGVAVSHENLLYNSEFIRKGLGTSSASIGVTWLPHFHDAGLVDGIIQPLYTGFLRVIISPIAFLRKPFRWLQAISRYKVTHCGGPNFAYDLCSLKITSSQLSGLDLSNWEVAYNSAEPIKQKTLKRFAAVFSPCGFKESVFYPGYGMAEATLMISGGLKTAPPVIQYVDKTAITQGKVVFCKAEQKNSKPLVGCGGTWLKQKIFIVDPETFTECPPNKIGEIWMSGGSVAQGYWNKPELTKETFQAYLEDTGEGPFLRTGDMGFMKDGELFVTGRFKDLIIIRGKNHYPQDVEITVEQSHK